MRWTILAIAALLAGCASTDSGSPMSITELQLRQRELHGQVVLVRGYLVACRGRWCRLSASPDETGQLPAGSKSLSVGGGDAFEAAASMISPAEILLKARVGGSAILDPDSGSVRADCCDLEAIEIARVIREIDGILK